MELKQRNNSREVLGLPLLIVLNGIETTGVPFIPCSFILLIVLNGIETHDLVERFRTFSWLLIVLNGIETKSLKFLLKFAFILLIVLNGIETSQAWTPLCPSRSFNRTKWNWNKGLLIQILPVSSFNRTKWNWNIRESKSNLLWWTFNRTKWNWNSKADKIMLKRIALLIVLNGIEITLLRLRLSGCLLLIVLNGISGMRLFLKVHLFPLRGLSLFSIVVFICLSESVC